MKKWAIKLVVNNGVKQANNPLKMTQTIRGVTPKEALLKLAKMINVEAMTLHMLDESKEKFTVNLEISEEP